MTNKDGKEAICANCGKSYYQSTYSELCDIIGKRKPTCSYECNKALGQVTVKGSINNDKDNK